MKNSSKSTETYTIQRKNRAKFVIIIAVVLAIAGALSVFVGVRAYLQLKTVVVTAADLPSFHIIVKEDLTTKEIPARFTEKMLDDPNTIIGQVTRTFIPKDSTIKEEQLAIGQNGGSILSAKVTQQNDKNVRGIFLPLDTASAIGGDVAEGDMVEIFGVVTLPKLETVTTTPTPTATAPTTNNNNKSKATQQQAQQPTLQPNVIVKKSNDNKIENVVSKQLAGPVKVLKVGRDGDGGKVTGIEISLTPQEIQDVIFARQTGTLMISVMPYDANILASLTYPTTSDTFFTQYITEIPPRLKKILIEKGMTEPEIAKIEAEYRQMLKSKLLIEDEPTSGSDTATEPASGSNTITTTTTPPKQ